MKNRVLTKRGLSIGQLSDRTGLSVSAIRHYESEGLVMSWRTPGGQRRFERSDIRRLSFVMISQELGFSLAEIGVHLAQLPAGTAPDIAAWNRMARGFREDIDARIAGLELLRDRLDSCIGCGCLSLKKCALYNPRDRAKRFGTGPRYLRGDPVSVD